MGNSRSHYERHEDDEQQERMVIGKEFRLVLGQLNLSKSKKILRNVKQQQQHHQKLSSSSSNSTITSSSSSFEQEQSSVAVIQLDIPTLPSDSNEFDVQTLLQYLFHQESYGKELSHLFQIPYSKSPMKSLPTVQLAAIYYDQLSTTNDFHTETISLLNETQLEEKLLEFNNKTILSIYSTKFTAYIIYTNNSSRQKRYKLIRSTTMSKTILENFEWLHPFIDYSTRGYRLCGIIPLNSSSSDISLTIDWLFEQIESDEIISYDYCLIEYQMKSFSWNNWTLLLNMMFKDEWKLGSTFAYYQKKKHGEQRNILLFFQRLKCERD